MITCRSTKGRVRHALCLLAVLFAVLPGFAQSRSHRISGQVSSEKGEPLVGAFVMVKGTTNGALTDAQGRYSINAPGNAVLVASLMGFEEQQAPVDSKDVINFVLREDNVLLQESVAIGYGTQSKITLTGSVTTTSGKELVNPRQQLPAHHHRRRSRPRR